MTRDAGCWLVDADRRRDADRSGIRTLQPLMLAHSLWRKLALTIVVGGGVVWLYEVTVLDSRFAAVQGAEATRRRPSPGARLLFSATAYCKGTTTASGVNVRSGIAAADPDLLPVGSVVQVDAPGARYDGVYTVMDTGPEVQGRHLDLYMWSCHEALRFGRTAIRIVVLRLGWNPDAQRAGPGGFALQAARDRRTRSAAALAAAHAAARCQCLPQRRAGRRARSRRVARLSTCSVRRGDVRSDLGVRLGRHGVGGGRWRRRDSRPARRLSRRLRRAFARLAGVPSSWLCASSAARCSRPSSCPPPLRSSSACTSRNSSRLCSSTAGYCRSRSLERVDDRAGHDQPREPLVIGRHDVPRRVVAGGVLDHVLVGVLIVVPEVALLGVGHRELPVLVLLLQAFEEALLLLALGHVEEELEDRRRRCAPGTARRS